MLITNPGCHGVRLARGRCESSSVTSELPASPPRCRTRAGAARTYGMHQLSHRSFPACKRAATGGARRRPTRMRARGPGPPPPTHARAPATAYAHAHTWRRVDRRVRTRGRRDAHSRRCWPSPAISKQGHAATSRVLAARRITCTEQVNVQAGPLELGPAEEVNVLARPRRGGRRLAGGKGTL